MSAIVDPFGAFQFSVRIDGVESVGGFSEVTGLGFESEVETVREGGFHDAEIQLLGPSKYPTRLVLKRGLVRGSGLWEWYRDVMQGRIRRRLLMIELNPTSDRTSRPPLSWTFGQACPVKWAGPAMQAATSAVAIEQVEFVHRGLQA